MNGHQAGRTIGTEQLAERSFLHQKVVSESYWRMASRNMRLTGNDLWLLPLSGDRKPFPFVQTPFSDVPGRFSPDGRWVVCESDDSGRAEVYVTPFPGPGGKRQVSAAGGARPRWRRDGKEIFYLSPDNKMMAATVNGQGGKLRGGRQR